jgi:hypothetical protein
VTCYRCRQVGHFARFCTEKAGTSRSTQNLLEKGKDKREKAESSQGKREGRGRRIEDAREAGIECAGEKAVRAAVVAAAVPALKREVLQ